MAQETHMADPSMWKEGYTERAKKFWADYQRTHDVSALRGKTAGIDPVSGRIWLGEDMLDVVDQRKAEGLDSPLFFERVGYATYYVKGGRR